MNCEVCKEVFNGIESFRQHEASEKHRKKLQLQNYTSSQSALNSTPDNETAEAAFPCTICALAFKTFSEFTVHTMTEDHARMILLKKDTESKLAEIVDANISSSHDVDSTTQDSVLKANLSAMATWQAKCEKCDKTFSGPEPYQQHIESLAHKKKCGLLLPVGGQPSACSSLFCDVCHIICSGPENYQQHMNGMPHRKKVLTVSNGGLDKSKDNTTSKLMGLLRCEICNKIFSGPSCYEQHLVSEAHKKVVDQSYYLKKFLGKENGGGSDLEERNGLIQPSAWYCEVCNIQCSGIEPYRQHLASKGHEKKSMRAGTDTKRNELISLLSNQTSTFDSLSEKGCSEVDGARRNRNATSRDMGQEVKKFLYGDDCCVKTFTPSDLDLTFFAVGEEIDFDKNLKIKIEAKDLDEIDVKEEENEDMDD